MPRSGARLIEPRLTESGVAVGSSGGGSTGLDLDLGMDFGLGGRPASRGRTVSRGASRAAESSEATKGVKFSGGTRLRALMDAAYGGRRSAGAQSRPTLRPKKKILQFTAHSGKRRIALFNHVARLGTAPHGTNTCNRLLPGLPHG